eukprot:Amastigsp_a176182_151.p3 type:complete len:236 gc:universal Amastigsp_a176182_151:29-736(+)
MALRAAVAISSRALGATATRIAGARSVASTSSALAKHTLPELPYAYDALAPVLSGKLMQLHHSKHHAAYVTNLNAALEKLAEAEAKNDIGGQIALQQAIRFNGGGHLNHALFWKNLAPAGTGGAPTGVFAKKIADEFGSVDAFQGKLAAAIMGIQGSGWGWLGLNKEKGRLVIATCANQDPLQPTTGLVPLLGVDAWEHGWYLDYENRKADYCKEVWKIINWKTVTARFDEAMSK